MIKEQKRPREIYLVATDWKSQLYSSSGRVKGALKTNGSFTGVHRRWVQVFVVVVDPHGMVPFDIGEDGWTDVTHEFIRSDGELK